MPDQPSFDKLKAFLARVPAVRSRFGTGSLGDSGWYVKFGIDVRHELAWRVVQELGHVLNYVSLNERLPTVFMPVSPPPYLNGDPEDFLSWVIECPDPEFPPDSAAEWLEGRLPVPVEDDGAWDLS